MYYCDISRESTNYVLITECIPYGEADGLTSGDAVGKILAKSNKYQDDRLADAHEYYCEPGEAPAPIQPPPCRPHAQLRASSDLGGFPCMIPALADALMRAFARIAAADKRGAFDAVISSFVADGAPVGGRPLSTISDARRSMSASRAAANFDTLIEFATVVAPHLFPADLCEPSFLRQAKEQCSECARYFDDAALYAASKPEFAALTHVNLQIDNGFFWRREGGELEAGLLDWYNCTRSPFAAIFMGCLSGAEPEVLTAHVEGMMGCFASEYAKAGGPQIEPLELLLQFNLLFVP